MTKELEQIETHEKEMLPKGDPPIEIYAGNLEQYVDGMPDPDGVWIPLPKEETELDSILHRISGGGNGDIVIMECFFREDCEYLKGSVWEWSDIRDLNIVARLIGNEPHPAVKAYMSVRKNINIREVANLLQQEADIPYYPYCFDGSDDPEIMAGLSKEEKMGYTYIEQDQELRKILENTRIGSNNLGAYINAEKIGRDMSVRCDLYEDGYFDSSGYGGLDLSRYHMDEIARIQAEKENKKQETQIQKQFLEWMDTEIGDEVYEDWP